MELIDLILHLQMSAEFQVPSPLVPTRENYFVRYCKLHPDGTWAVVDVSLDSLRPSPISRSRRRPSGCLIQELPNGYSKVTFEKHFMNLVHMVDDIFCCSQCVFFLFDFRLFGLSM